MTLKTKAVDVEAIGAQLPNLDGINSYEEAITLGMELRQVEDAVRTLRNYAEGKGMAAWLRERGSVSRAQELEVHIEAIYAALPDWAKW